MYVSFDYYKNTYLGTKLSEDIFPKFAEKGERYIEKCTFNRINEDTFNTFPEKIQTLIKKCVCELSDAMFDTSKMNDLIISSGQESSGIVKSKTAGAVSLTYDTTAFTSKYLSEEAVANRYNDILQDYLYPQYIDGKYYNFLSKVEVEHIVRKDCNTL